MNNFQLVAKILKQYKPGSEERQFAQYVIGVTQKNYSGQLLTLKLKELSETKIA